MWCQNSTPNMEKKLGKLRESLEGCSVEACAVGGGSGRGGVVDRALNSGVRGKMIA